MVNVGKYTAEDIMRMVEDENIRFIRLQFTDIFGSFKNIAITASQLEKALQNKCMFDGSSIEGFVRIEESDMYLYPDLDSFVIFPWYGEGERAARLICDVYKPDGTPFEGDPRGLLKKVLRQAEEMGFSGFNVGPECEFFLFNYDEDGHPTTKSFDRGAYFELGPTDLGESARRDMCLALEDMGFEIEASHHECANGQHEIDFKYADALCAADNIVTFKLVVKTVAYAQYVRHLHAETGLRQGGQRHACKHVPDEGREKRVLRPRRFLGPEQNGLQLYRGHPRTRPRDVRGDQSAGQFL